MKIFRAVTLAAVLAVPGAPSSAASTGAAFFKSHVKPGLYEQKTEADMSGMPNVPKGQEKFSDTKQSCVTQEEVDKGVQFARDCTVRSQDISGNTARISSQCRDGASHQMTITSSANGFTSEMKTVGKAPDGKSFTVTLRSQSRYLGPCPASGAAPR